MKLGLISLGGPSSKDILKKCKEHFSKTKSIDIREIEVHITSNGLHITYQGKPLEHFDCLYVRGSYKYVSLKKSITLAKNHTAYMPLKPLSFVGHDKFLTALELQKSKIPIPTTYLAATTIGAKKLLEHVHYPIIMKIPSGTQGRGIMFADSITSAKSILDTLEVFKQPYIIQEYIETNATDLRVLVLGDKVVAAMKRKAQPNELRANIHRGGIGINYEVDKEVEEIAIKTAQKIEADICGIDILEGRKPVVVETNLSPGIQGLAKATKKDIALEIAKFLKEQTNNFFKEQKETDYKKIIKGLEAEKSNEIKEMITNIKVKAGIIKLPEVINKVTSFKDDQEVIFIAKKGKLIIKEH